MKQKKKYFNLRLFFIGFLGMLLGMLTFFHYLNIVMLNKLTLWFILFVLIFILNVVGIVVSSVRKNLRKYLKYLIIFVLLFVVGLALFGIKFNHLTKYKSYDEECLIDGVVDNYYYQNNRCVIILNRAKINDENVDSKVKLYLISENGISDELSLGDRISASTQINLVSIITDKINICPYVDNTVYSGYVTGDNIELTNHNPKLVYAFKERLRFVLNKGFNNQNSELTYGILLGEKVGIDDDVRDVFSYAGISHILAVSGLHVGFLVGFITFLLNCCRIGRRARFFITSIILIFYSILCGLTPSILRASFMSIILLLAGVLGEEYDGLNSLGIAGILILLLFPLELFSIGFQLSFMCVFMIMTLADKMSKLLKSWRVPEKLSSAISVSMCVTLGSSIIMANTMNYVSIISIVSNLVVIPLFGVVFPLLFMFSLISMIIPAISGLLIIPEILLHFIKLIANLFADINFARFRVFHLGYLILFCFIILSILIKFFMGSRRVKIPICITLALICFIVAIFGLKPLEYKSYALYTNYQYESNSALLTTNSGKKYLVGVDDYGTNSFLLDMKIKYLDVVVIPDFEVNKIDRYVEIFDGVKVGTFVVPSNENYSDIIFETLNEISKVKIVDNYNDDMSLKFIKNKNDIVCGTEIFINNKGLLFTNGVTKTKLLTLGECCAFRYDYIVTNESKYDFYDYGIASNKIIHSNDLDFETSDAISLKNKNYYMLELG